MEGNGLFIAAQPFPLMASCQGDTILHWPQVAQLACGPQGRGAWHPRDARHILILLFETTPFPRADVSV